PPPPSGREASRDSRAPQVTGDRRISPRTEAVPIALPDDGEAPAAAAADRAPPPADRLRAAARRPPAALRPSGEERGAGARLRHPGDAGPGPARRRHRPLRRDDAGRGAS